MYKYKYWRKGKHTMMKLIGSLRVGGKTFSMKDSVRTVYPKQLGLPDNFYGGSVKEFRITKEGFYLVIGHGGNIINLGYIEGKLELDGEMLLHQEKYANAPAPQNIDSQEMLLEVEKLYPDKKEKETRTKNSTANRNVR